MNRIPRSIGPWENFTAVPNRPCRLLWVDLSRSAPSMSTAPQLASRYRMTTSHDWEGVPYAIRSISPDVLGIEYDWPKLADLAPIAELARSFPGLPIVVVSAGHSEALLLEAMRLHA
jgi:DNA-binding NarL/FixJ family response regulator